MSSLLPQFLRGTVSNNSAAGGEDNVATRRPSIQASNNAPQATPTSSGAQAATSSLLHSVDNLEWSRRLYSINLSKREVEQLVMNYLIIEGFKDAAEKFSQESGIRPLTDLSAIDERMQIRQAIQAGNIPVAIDKINDLSGDLLDSNPKIAFHLQQQQMIELIRSGQVEAALAFAQEELAPRAESHPEFLRELEKTMALLVFDTATGGKGVKPTLKDLIDPAHRMMVANEVNTALLSTQNHENESKLPLLLRLLHGMQETLGKKTAFPKIVDYAKLTFEPELLTPDQVQAASVKARAMAFSSL